VSAADEALQQRALQIVSTVVDPEIPALTIAELGILREVTARAGEVEVAITPTYSGCPAMTMIALDIQTALAAAGITKTRIRTVLSPAWTTDQLTETARAKLARVGIAPPPLGAARRALFAQEAPRCPRCNSANTEQISEFGSTACKSLHRCRACGEPFDYFKCH
jgi:ring-1,2-phenylacetyl-CoA epoxidase subunit PaaD